MIENIEYNCLPGLLFASKEDFLAKCSHLYSNHYGIWGNNGVRPGENIKLSSHKISEWLENENVNIYYATINDELIGYAIAFSLNVKNYGILTWVTQLVVHENYRHQGIAKNLLFSIWGFSNHYAWGIVSANPYAIRALEKATRRRATPIRIKKNSTKIKNIGKKHVPFIQDNTTIEINTELSVINTEFFVAHGDTEEMIFNVTQDNVPWLLGMIEEGWEWFAFTFNDQKQINLTQEEIENMVATSDSVVQKAYSRMDLNPQTQTWMKNTKDEIDYIISKTCLKENSLIYDLGCGTGRHSIELAKRNFHVVGIDYISKNIELAKQNIDKNLFNNLTIEEADCRHYNNTNKASAVLCLYDVIGSFADDKDNIKIIRTAYDLLAPNGYAIFSVMNYESTLANAKNTFVFEKDANRLLELPASNTQETSGNVFNPDHYIVDTSTQLIYRKEQFSVGNQLPIELIVRDRRFTMKEFARFCSEIGFTVIESKYTNASDWKKSYEAKSDRAKEILIICKKQTKEVFYESN